MGLGKTLQTIALLLLLRAREPNAHGPYLVVCPLTLLDNWRRELARFAPSLPVQVYTGDQVARAVLRAAVAAHVNALPTAADRADPPLPFRVVLTTYETVNADLDYLRQFRWRYLVVDEAARLKNADALLYRSLRALAVPRTCLLTGTPVQNDLGELHALLAFGMPDLFTRPDAFVAHFAALGGASPSPARAAELHALLRPFVLRRTKDDVLDELPPKREILVYAPLTPLQRHLYRALVVRDLALIDAQQKKGLNNLLMQLRKCVNHPYLFDGVEAEPFALGDHLVHVSGKLIYLDRLLALLRRRGHRVLVFSQMTRMLDIVQGQARPCCTLTLALD
jgi:chromodomain-helicase-DNA-binding protein 1-like